MILSFWSWWIGSLLSNVPSHLVKWVIGPMGTIRVTGTGVFAENIKRIRPCDVLIDEVWVLRQTHSLPAEAARDFQAAIDLNIETTTPFSAREVLVGARVFQDAHSPGLRRVDVAIVPMQLVKNALLACGVNWRQVRTLQTMKEPIQSIALPSKRWSLLAVISVVAMIVAVAGLLVGGINHYVAGQNVISELDARLTELRPRVVELIEEVRARTEAPQSVTLTGEAAPFFSLTSLLLDLSDALPGQAELLRLDLRADGLRVAVRAKDVMALVGELRTHLVPWDVVVDGNLQVDPATNLETGTALIRAHP